jgi:malate dehydrogenase (oxaloacetate-decarboxylating)(NADP+)
MDSGVAQFPVDIEQYQNDLERRLGKAHEVMRFMIQKARRKPCRVVFPEGSESKILRAAQILLDEKIAYPVLIGPRATIEQRIRDLHLDIPGAKIVDPADYPNTEAYIGELYHLRQRKGITRSEAEALRHNPTLFGAMMLHCGDADALIAGLTQHYPDTIRPALQVIPLVEGRRRVAGMYMLITKSGDIYFLADATVNIEPSADELAQIAVMAAAKVREFDIEPRVAMLSFSNFGSTRHPLAEKVARATEIARKLAPDLIIDGEMQADTAVTREVIEQTYPFSHLQGGANVLIFPNLEAGNIAYKLLQRIGGAEAIGPILMGLSKPVHVLQRGCEVSEIVNMAAIAVVDAQMAG